MTYGKHVRVYPLKPHFYLGKLGFTGLYLIFLFKIQNIHCGYSCTHNVCFERKYKKKMKKISNEMFMFFFSSEKKKKKKKKKNLCILHFRNEDQDDKHFHNVKAIRLASIERKKTSTTERQSRIRQHKVEL